MKNILPKSTRAVLRKVSFLGLIASGLCGISAQAQDIVFVTAYLGSTLTPCPTVCKVSGSYSTFGSTEVSQPTTTPPPTRSKSTYGYSQDFSWNIVPTLNVAGAIYRIDVAHTTATTSPDALVTATTSDGTLSPSCVNSPVFNAAYAKNQWHFFGYITNNPGVTQPTITFAVSGGTVGPTSGANRLYVDAFKFTEVGNPCDGVAPDVGVNGPLAANQTFVNVTGVDAAASVVSVYADGGLIGELFSPNIVAGANTVTVSSLYAGAEIKATQTKNGCTSHLPPSGPIVGGGANPMVKAYLSVWQDSRYAGPIGTNTTTGLNTNYILKASGLRQGSQSAQNGGHDIYPSQCWETVTFDHANDAAIYPNNGFNVTEIHPFCALDALVFCIDDGNPDSGPYDIYVDRIMNGDVVIEDFESYPVGSTNIFRAPNAATTPSPGVTYLSSPNSSLISTNNAFDGTKSVRIRWQWANNSFVRWSRVIANATAGKTYPQLDTSKPITIRYLVLPVGETTNKLSASVVPQTQTRTIGENVTLDVVANGDGPFSYQWKYNDVDLPGETNASFTKNNVQLSDSGKYEVAVTGAFCSASYSAILTVTDVVNPPTLVSSVNGGQITLTWDGNFTLQSKTTIDGTWNDVTSTSGYSESASTGTKFFRLRQ